MIQSIIEQQEEDMLNVGHGLPNIGQKSFIHNNSFVEVIVTDRSDSQSKSQRQPENPLFATTLGVSHDNQEPLQTNFVEFPAENPDNYLNAGNLSDDGSS